MFDLQVIRTRIEGRVLFETLDALPLNLIGPGIVSDLVYRLLIDGELVARASARRSDGRGRGLIGIR